MAFFGVGLMGEPMAGRLLAAGHTVVVVAHRTRSGVERLVAKGAVEATNVAAAMARTDTMIMMLPTADDVEALLFGSGGAESAVRRGHTVVDMGTSFPAQTRHLAVRVIAQGGRYLDAPVTGGPKGAQGAPGGACSLLVKVQPDRPKRGP